MKTVLVAIFLLIGFSSYSQDTTVKKDVINYVVTYRIWQPPSGPWITYSEPFTTQTEVVNWLNPTDSTVRLRTYELISILDLRLAKPMKADYTAEQKVQVKERKWVEQKWRIKP